MTTTKSCSKSDVVTLKPGIVVPVAALRILWDLEDRGFALRVADEQIVIAPRSALTHGDRVAIRRHRGMLIRLINYCADDPASMVA